MESKFSPQNILLVVKAHNIEAARLADDVSFWLQQKGCTVAVRKNTDNSVAYKNTNADLILIFGGDGTVLGVARALVENPIPLVALNFGKVGLLAELEAEHWEEGLTDVLEGRVALCRYMALGWRVIRGGKIVYQGYAINDVVIGRGALSRLIALEVHVDAEYMCDLRADGLIISSPVGSSGYVVSAGGPLAHPAHVALIVMPICPYLCNFPPMVLPHSSIMRAVVQASSTETYITIDGQQGFLLEAYDSVEVFCVPEALHFARRNIGMYFDVLKKRGFIKELAPKNMTK